MAVQRDPSVWGEDAGKWDPERWLNPDRIPPANQLTAGVHGLFTFIEGPRTCIGYRLGGCTHLP